MTSTGDPGICSAANNSVARNGRVNPAALLTVRYDEWDAGFDTCVAIGSKMHMTNLGKGGRIEVMFAGLRWMMRVN